VRAITTMPTTRPRGELVPRLGFRATSTRDGFAPPDRDDVRLSFIDAAMAAPVGREKPVLVALAASAPRIMLTLATIADRSGVDVRTAQRHIEALEADGFVQVYEQAPDGGDWTLRPPKHARKRARRRLAFVLHLPDGTQTRSTRHPADDHGLASLGDQASRKRTSVHC
jgi:hypothetical protein